MLGWRIIGMICLLLCAQDGHPLELEEDIDLLDEFFERKDKSRDSMPVPAVAGYVPEADTLFTPSKPLPPLRLIDSPLYQDLTTDARLNARLSTKHPFTVQITRPQLQNMRGYPLIHGFETWYLYVVKAEQIRLNGKLLRTNGMPTYIAIVSPLSRLDELPPLFESPALMLKGIVDYGDTIVKHFSLEKKRLKKELDSLLKQPISSDELRAEEQVKMLESIADSLEYAESYYELYRQFRRVKSSGRAIIEFFLSFPFNRTLTYSIYSAPYALPQYVPSSTVESKPPKRKRS
ncbi:MAG: hypothetical protein RMK19_08020 [Bacteroidia bacterium]|nr:hypothetical protein [Bacteroidia bacterium]MDW8015942.1 hypothetical protein [Bacteroidia bacterium]